MADHFYIVQGDLLPAIPVQALNGDGTAVDLTTAAVTFSMKNRSTLAVKVDDGVAIVTDGATGRVEYRWTGTDTDTAGQFAGEFTATIAGKTFTIPGADFIYVHIRPKANP